MIMETKNVNASQVYDYKSLIKFEEGEVASTVISETKGGEVIMKAAAEGTEIKEHSVPYVAVLYVLDGEAEVWIEGKAYNPHEGQILVVPANARHSLKAKKAFTVLLSVVAE